VPELWVLDFERARCRRRVPARLRRRALAKLDREAGRTPCGPRLRFLLAYAGDDARAARRWWRAVEAHAPALARRDAARLRRHARPGRRARRVRLPGWTGIAARDVPEPRLAGAVALATDAAGSVHGAPDCDAWTVVLEATGVGPARDAWARAGVLFARGLAPRPLGVLCSARSAVLVLERAPRSVTVCEVRRNDAVEAALRVLARRLRADGRPRDTPIAEGAAVSPAGPGSVAVWLLDVERFGLRPRFGGRAGPAPPAP